MNKRGYILLSILVAISITTKAQDPGSIEGVVKYENGEAAIGAHVRVFSGGI